MNEFIELRKRAREKRDKAIAFATQEYESTLASIAALEQDLTGKESSRHKSISACIEAAIPSDRPFTAGEILQTLEASDPRRPWRKRSVDHYICRLRGRGLVRRVRRGRSGHQVQPALYARVGLEVPDQPFGDLRCVDVIRAVLTKPMNATEITMAMLGAGYQTAMDKKALRDQVGMELRRGRFSREGRKWVVG